MVAQALIHLKLYCSSAQLDRDSVVILNNTSNKHVDLIQQVMKPMALSFGYHNGIKKLRH